MRLAGLPAAGKGEPNNGRKTTVQQPAIARKRPESPKVLGPRMRLIKKHLPFYFILLPAVVFFFVFHYIPIYGITLAIKDYRFDKGIFFSPFAAPLFKYFTSFFTYYEFETILRNTIIVGFLKVVVAFPIPIVFALMINELRGRWFKKIVQSVSYLPSFVSWVAVTVFLSYLLSADGIVNSLRQSLAGLEPIRYLTDADYFLAIMFSSFMWKTMGMSSIIFLAAISGVDQSLYEAAMIDGCGKLRQIWHVTLPSILPTTVYLFILGLASILNAGWDQIYLISNAGNIQVSNVIDTYVIEVGLRGAQYGYATAVSLFQGVIGLALVLITNKLSKKLTDISLF